MKVRICPLCDSEMKKAHYCDTCHSFVWRPEILDVHYNAQQRGMGEEDCAYGAEHDKKDHYGKHNGRFSDVLKKAGKTSKKPSSHEEVYGQNTQKTTAHHRSKEMPDENKRKAGGCLAKIILAGISLNAVICSVGSSLFNFFTGDEFRCHIENVLNELGIEDDISIWESESEDADDNSHFEMTKDELEEVLSAWVNNEYGQALQKTEDNVEQEGTYVDEDGNEYSIPEIGTYYTMGENQDYLALYSDHDTSQVKVVTAMFEDEERAKSFGVMAALILDPESGYDPSDWETELDELIDQVKEENVGQSEYGYVSREFDDMVVVATKFTTGEICITLEAMDYQ